MAQRRRRDRDGSYSRTVSDLLAGHAVFGELRDQRARQNEVEELIDLRNQRALRLLPWRAPEDGENLDGGQQRAIAVGELGRGGGGRCSDIDRGLPRIAGVVQRNDSNGISARGANLSARIGSGRHGR